MRSESQTREKLILPGATRTKLNPPQEIECCGSPGPFLGYSRL